MPRIEKLSDSKIEAVIAPAKGEAFLWERSGLGVRVGLRRRTFVVQYRVAGRQRRLVLGHLPALSLAAARVKAAEALARVARGEDPAAEGDLRDERPTLREFSERYLEHQVALGRLRAVTLKEYRRLLAKIILPALGDLRLDAIGSGDVQRMHDANARRPYVGNRALAVLSAVFGFARKRKALPAGHPSPTEDVELYPERKRERLLSEAELAALGEELAAHEARYPLAVAALRVLVFTGARKTEIASLRWAELDLAAACIRLPAERTKEGRAKTLPLAPPALEVLARLPRLDDEFVFPSSLGSAPIGLALERVWWRVRTAGGLEDVHLHDLRHAFASTAVATGHSLVVTGALLGHRQPSTTQRYAHLSTDPLRAASDVIGARLAAALEARPKAPVVSIGRSSA